MENVDLLEFTGMPERVISVLKGIEIDIPETDLNRSLFFYGPSGSGKTIRAATTLAQSLFKVLDISHVREMLRPNSYEYIGDRTPWFAKQYIFTRVPDLLLKIKSTYNKIPNQYQKEIEKDIIDLYSNASLLVLDDLGTELTTDWAYFTLYLIVDNRYNNMLPTIFTSNFSLEQLVGKFVDERLVSRIMEMCTKKGVRRIGGKDKVNYRLEIYKGEK
jgi:DNA replication protein DnaC